MFTTNDPSLESATLLRCNHLMRQYNDSLQATIDDFKHQWWEFWDQKRTVDEMQAQLDYLSQQPVTYKGTASNALSVYFAEGLANIAFILDRNPDAFNDAVPDAAGTLQPISNQPYRLFLTPGWYYTIDELTGRIIVSGPCVY